MTLGGIEVMTFDVVGTLIDFETGILDCLRPVVRGASLTVGDHDLLEAFGRAEAEQARETPELPFTQMLAPIYGRMAADLGLPDRAPQAEALRESIPRWPAFPDAVNALRDLGHHYRLVALTNADNWALDAMSATLGSPFDDAVTAEDVGVNKPDPQMFAYCLGRQSVHGYQRGSVLHVAQSQFHDIGAAHALGLRTCWVERRQGRHGFGATPAPAAVTTPDLHVSSLDELARASREAYG
ncbi:HAD-IA family hydrolase [Phytoactinopolyspora alkaliphila]|uniref:HAD-IA family hydrolase n=1 Tax=Phytoactinopolyspora alkaliphila TaxID=1783498 RepID=A0A6N9YU57_9ACTN|nr:HAD-IA family hydrolase [Phytoactinopolyspora alkaliphila]NED98477.1 HAD-IA family hydrolase [Phytoactinopolyspora alkaliphila]